jgi:hypothetical protein
MVTRPDTTDKEDDDEERIGSTHSGALGDEAQSHSLVSCSSMFYMEEGVGTSSSHLASADRVSSTKVILQTGAFVLTSPPPPLVVLGDSPARAGMGGLVTPDPILRTKVQAARRDQEASTQTCFEGRQVTTHF